MPTYDYVCDACAHRFEEFQSFSAAVLTDCPKCGAAQLRRLFGTGAAILFKGSGFYETDYRSDGYKSAEKSDKEAAKPAESKGSDAPAKSSEGEKNGRFGENGQFGEIDKDGDTGKCPKFGTKATDE